MLDVRDSNMTDARQLDSIVDALGGVVWEYDWAGESFTYVSEGAQRLLGFTRDEWLQPRFWLDRIYPPDAQEATRFCAEATTAGQDHDFTYRMVRRDGTPVWVRDIVTVDKELGMAGRLRGILVDVTHHMETEHGLRARNEEFEAVFLLMRDAYLRVESDGRLSNAVIPGDLGPLLSGQTPEHIQDLHPQFSATIDSARRRATQSGQMALASLSTHTGDQTHHWEVRALPLDFDTTVVVIEDITGVAEGVQMLEEAEARCHTMVDRSPLAMHFYELDETDTLVLVSANPVADTLLCAHHEPLAGRPIEETLLSRIDPSPAASCLAVARDGGHWRGDDVTLDCAGEQRIFEMTVFQTWPRRIAVILNDVTERKHAEARERQHLAKLSAMAAELTTAEERERRRLAEELHDRVGQPLAVALMHLCAAGGTSDGDLAPVRKLLEAAARQVRSVTTELAPPILYELGLESALRWQFDELESQYDISIDQRLQLDESGMSPEAKMVLFRAARELIMNVVKHAQTDTATVQLESSADRTTLLVKDDGVGFNTNDTRINQGFGLFSLCERVPYLGGRIDIRSEVGTGTQVELSIPHARPA